MPVGLVWALAVRGGPPPHEFVIRTQSAERGWRASSGPGLKQALGGELFTETCLLENMN